MASFIQTSETLTQRQAGVVSRHGAQLTTRALNQAAGSAEGLLLAPSGTTGLECIAPSTAALVKSAVGFSVFRPLSEDFDSTHHYADNEAVALMEEGHMYVLAEGTVVADGKVYARHTSDGGSNTVLGKVSGNSGGTLVIDTTSTVEGYYTIELFNGVANYKFGYDTDGSATAAEIIAGLVAAIDAHADFAAAGTTEITITMAGASTELTIVELKAPTQAAQALWTTTDNQKCTAVPGTFFDESRTGAGLVEIRRAKVN